MTQTPYGSGLLPSAPPRPKPRAPWLFVGAAAGTVFGFMVSAIAGSSHQDTPTITATSAPMPTVQAPAGTVLHGGGTYRVGEGNGKIQPGEWRTPGVTGDSCYWARLTNTTGDLGSIAANGNLDGGPGVITVSAQDAALTLKGPCVWTRQ
jgi:hypothetical protein